MVVLQCPIDSCPFRTPDVEVVGAAAVLTIHGSTHTSQPAAPTPAQPRGPKLIRPKIKLNSTNEEWNAFIRRWNTFTVGSNITDVYAPAQLLECTNDSLGDIVLRACPDFTTRPILEATTLLKTFAVIPVALGVVRNELNSMSQDPDETFRTFAAKVQGKAETCEFVTKYSGTCSAVDCGTRFEGQTYYTDERIRDVLLHGIANVDIRIEPLSVQGIQQRSVPEIIAYVETREIARNANRTNGVSAVSGYRRQERPLRDFVNRSQSPSATDKTRTASCPGCRTTFHLFSKLSRGWNTKPHQKCVECWKKERPNKRSPQGETGAMSSMDHLGQMSVITCEPRKPSHSKDHLYLR